MVDPGSEVTDFPALVVTLIVGATIVVIVYISSLFKSQKEEAKKRSVVEPVVKEKQHQHQQHADAGNARKKKQHSEKWRADTKQNFTHPWLVTSLKGHGGAVLDMDFSPNGKFLASCAEDGGGSGTSSGSEGNKENNPAIRTPGLTRRQKKNHRIRRDDSSSPGTAVKKKTGQGKSKNNSGTGSNGKQHTKLGWSTPDAMLIQYLQHYLLQPDELLWLGYPVESPRHPGMAMVFKRSLEAILAWKTKYPTGFDVNAREFVPKECFYASSLVERNTDPDLQPYITFSPVCQWKRISSQEDLGRGKERKCVRCGKEFFLTREGTYLTQEQCLYHWGKLKKQFNDTAVYDCCRAKKNSKGCTTAKLHVWNGLQDNWVNVPLHGFVRTKARKTPPPDGNNGVYALDCEMCYTTHGLELAKVTVVGADGRLVYDTYVRPENEIIDYNTRFSGVTAKEMNKRGASKLLKDVQNDLMGFINADTILIGHGLENDLIALKMIHATIVDTSFVFPHFYGFPYRRSLKSLVECFLKRSIQCEATGHDSFEDARSCLELMLWKLRSDMGSICQHTVQLSSLSNNRL